MTTTLAHDAPECPVCHKRMNLITAGHFRLHGYADAKSFKEAFGLTLLKAPSIAAKQSAFMSANSPTKGRKRTDAEVALMSEKRTGKGVGVAGKYERTAAIREKISKGVTEFQKQHPDGYTNRFFKSGWVHSVKADQKVYVRSSWETRVLAVLDHYDAITEIMVEPFEIPYEYEGGMRYYTPDILVTFNEVVQELWEIKPAIYVDRPKNQAKFKAAQAYADKHGIGFRVVTLEHIEAMERKTKAWVEQGCPPI